ncbi:hypothetical protein [Bifidobacterium imperatoris]|uniref:hypothetical protein n=1 Tax=Bifidobacterium imperatoris TaxID=2020965 RepID=UPI001F6136DF|nr:hypothetical protein [Bifidobacterium imperatoris]
MNGAVTDRSVFAEQQAGLERQFARSQLIPGGQPSDNGLAKRDEQDAEKNERDGRNGQMPARDEQQRKE